MDTNSNAYTFLYASGMVIIVATVLAFIAISLQPMQEANVVIEKKQNILSSVGMSITPEEADATYAKVVKEDFAIKADGTTIDGITGFQIDMVEQVSKVNSERELPVFKAVLKDGSIKTIIPVRGKGLWGPIWGFVALDADLNTIYGTSFDHKGETPGLGADINKPFFEDQFKGKKLFDDETFKLMVYKGGKGAAATAGDLAHGVDAISSGTITCKGLESMLKDCLSPYQSYFKNNKK